MTQIDLPLQTIIRDRKSHLEQKENLNCGTRTPLNIWFEEYEKLKLGNQMKLLRWVAYDKEFAPAQQDNCFKRWSARGVWTSDAGQMHSFERLEDKHDLEKQDYFRYRGLDPILTAT